MSKKIIYLLSLIMALSLVFASCKKNSGLDPNNIGGGDQIKDEDNSGTTGDNGLYEDYTNIPDLDKPIITYKVFELNGTETYRNSIIVPMGTAGNYLAVFSENRYDAVTSDNDIALDGNTITDIVYNLSTKAGKEGSWTGKRSVGTKAQTVKDSRAAIVVFKVDDTHVVIVASQGAGISRVGTEYENRKWSGTDEPLKSNLQYIVGTLDEQNNTFTWNGWKDIKVNGSDPLSTTIESKQIKDGANNNFAQFGTHSARGFVKDKTIYVPIVLATQGKTGGAKELMGNIILKGTYNGSTDITSWELSDSIAFDPIGGSYPDRSKQKESRVYDVDNSGKAKYLTVPNGSAAGTDKFLFTGVAGEKPSVTTISAGDGSVGLTKVKWYGSSPYTVKTYKDEMASPNNILVMHVANTESNLHIYLTDLNLAGNIRKYKVNDIGKASSIDVLPDGTIITLAEEGLASGTANQRKFNVVFKKYSQKYLDSILK